MLFLLILGSVMTGTDHDMLTKLLKMNPPTLQSNESENAFDFITNYYERLHKMSIVKQHGVKFVIFLLEKDAKQWQRAHVKYWSPVLPLLTYDNFITLFLDKYVLRTLRDSKKDELLALEQGDMSIAPYEAKFSALICLATEDEKI